MERGPVPFVSTAEVQTENLANDAAQKHQVTGNLAGGLWKTVFLVKVTPERQVPCEKGGRVLLRDQLCGDALKKPLPNSELCFISKPFLPLGIR